MEVPMIDALCPMKNITKDMGIGWAASESLLAENTNQKGTNYKWEMRKASNILSDLAQGKSVWGYLYSNEEVLSVCEKVGISPGFFSIDMGAGKHTYLLQESGKTINVDAKIKQLNDINWIEIGYKEGDTFSVYAGDFSDFVICTFTGCHHSICPCFMRTKNV